ncbi:cupredoxin domain-containing protein [Variovorax sp. LjRoot290]|uniref:cupredoxin domain-containing protein n=1 Tax=Variovorax sp. LjRoot290 TaxID=3342316 RepID=UPI003ECDF38C
MKSIKALMLASTLALSGVAFAHGDEDHSEPSGPIRKEQKDWGIAGDARAAKRTLTFKMTDDMHFTPDRIQVKQGETVRISIKNDGKLMHEFVLGTKKELDEHAALMVKFPSMAHDEPYMAHVAPGKTGEIVWTFNRAGDFDFACLVADHYEAGMVGKVKVVASSSAKPSPP